MRGRQPLRIADCGLRNSPRNAAYEVVRRVPWIAQAKGRSNHDLTSRGCSAPLRKPRHQAICFATILTFLLVGSIAGCGQPAPTKTLTIDQILSQHNTNAAKIPKLRANPQVQVSLKRTNSLLPFTYTFDTATLLLGKEGCPPFGPYDFVLIGREAGRDMFRLGSNVEQNAYYMWFQAGSNAGLWRGRLNLAGAPGVTIPLDPNQLVAALAVTELPSDLTTLPTVCMTMFSSPARCFEPAEYAYILTYIDRQPVTRRIIFRRELFFRWSDTEPPRMYKINFLDASGNRIMTADLSDYKPLTVEGLDAKELPVMPTRINVSWGENRLTLQLTNMTIPGLDPAEASKLLPPSGLPEIIVDEDVNGGATK